MLSIYNCVGYDLPNASLLFKKYADFTIQFAMFGSERWQICKYSAEISIRSMLMGIFMFTIKI